MGDGSSIGGWILTAAIITVLAGGAGAVGGGSGGRSGSGSGDAAGGSTATRTAARAADTATTRPRPACTTVVTRYSADRTKYTRYPANAAGTLGCGLIQGDRGAPVLTLKGALRQCYEGRARGLTSTRVFDASTETVLSRAQVQLRTIRRDGVYDGETAVRLNYPWYTVSDNRFTGRCSPTGTRVP
jgi:hypothetical protein